MNLASQVILIFNSFKAFKSPLVIIWEEWASQFSKSSNLFKELNANGYKLHIISGNIVDVIEFVLGENAK